MLNGNNNFLIFLIW